VTKAKAKADLKETGEFVAIVLTSVGAGYLTYQAVDRLWWWKRQGGPITDAFRWYVDNIRKKLERGPVTVEPGPPMTYGEYREHVGPIAIGSRDLKHLLGLD